MNSCLAFQLAPRHFPQCTQQVSVCEGFIECVCVCPPAAGGVPPSGNEFISLLNVERDSCKNSRIAY